MNYVLSLADNFRAFQIFSTSSMIAKLFLVDDSAPIVHDNKTLAKVMRNQR